MFFSKYVFFGSMFLLDVWFFEGFFFWFNVSLMEVFAVLGGFLGLSFGFPLVLIGFWGFLGVFLWFFFGFHVLEGALVWSSGVVSSWSSHTEEVKSYIKWHQPPKPSQAAHQPT